MKLRRTMRAQSPKNNEKERKNNNKKKKKKGLGLGQAKGHAARRRISIRPEDMQQEESTSRP